LDIRGKETKGKIAKKVDRQYSINDLWNSVAQEVGTDWKNIAYYREK